MSDKMREEFEAWVSKSKVCISKGARVQVRTDGHYKDGRVDLQWKAWKASRAAMVQDGWQLVPVEPTMATREAFHEANEEWEGGDNWRLDSPDHQWQAMLDAAPKP